MVGDIARRVQLFRNRGVPALRRGDAVVGQRMLAAPQLVGIGVTLREPAIIVAADLIAMIGAEVDMLESIERSLHPILGVATPIWCPLIVIGPTGAMLLGRLHQRRRRLLTTIDVGPAPRIADIADILQVRLSDQRGRIAARAQQFDEGCRIARQRHAVGAHAMDRRHPASHQGRTVRHADAGRDIKSVEPGPTGSQRIDMRRA